MVTLRRTAFFGARHALKTNLRRASHLGGTYHVLLSKLESHLDFDVRQIKFNFMGHSANSSLPFAERMHVAAGRDDQPAACRSTKHKQNVRPHLHELRSRGASARRFAGVGTNASYDAFIVADGVTVEHAPVRQTDRLSRKPLAETHWQEGLADELLDFVAIPRICHCAKVARLSPFPRPSRSC